MKIRTRTALGLAAATLVLTGVSTASPAQAAVGLTKSITCVSNQDSGYRARLYARYNTTSTTVDVERIEVTFEHRTLGIWNTNNWGSSYNTRYVKGTLLLSQLSGDPGYFNWLEPGLSPVSSGSVAVTLVASGSPGGVTKSISSCSIPITTS